MSERSRRPPAGEPWVWLTRELLQSDAWRSRGINAGRLIDFLLVEHMAHGGTANGKLMAPRRQLERYGIGSRHVSGAIEQAEMAGLVEVRRGGMRVAVLYALTWLPGHDGTPPSNRWRSFRNPELRPVAKSRNLPSLRKPGQASEGASDEANLAAQGTSDARASLTSEGKPLYRDSYRGSSYTTDVSRDASCRPTERGNGRG